MIIRITSGLPAHSGGPGHHPTPWGHVSRGSDAPFSQVPDLTSDRSAGTAGAAAILCPVVGPEALTGSTRMKGGTATKLVLETIFWHALAATTAHTPPTAAAMAGSLRQYEVAMRAAYREPEAVAELVGLAGAALTAGGRVLYVGDGPFGIVGLIDSSECPPTY